MYQYETISKKLGKKNLNPIKLVLPSFNTFIDNIFQSFWNILK